MELTHNSTFRLLKDGLAASAYASGIYRVVLDEPRSELTVAVLIAPDEIGSTARRGGRKKSTDSLLKRPRKRAPQPFVGKLIWMDRTVLIRLHAERLLLPITIERTAAPALCNRGKAEYEARIAAMAGFLDAINLQDSIRVHHDLGALITEATTKAGVSRYFVYRNWSDLCRWGIDAKSLVPRRDRCGAPGVPRPCDPVTTGRRARKKAGRKTIKQRIARAFGDEFEPVQPGMSTEWAAAIRAADKRIPSPKPPWPERCNRIVESQFCGKAAELNGQIVFVKPELGQYPNDAQIRRILIVESSRIQRLIERTTKRHFDMARRGLVARNWRDVAGPGHTWAIDSTVGDIYLRSSVRREWILGRPIVYIIVDVWSTAVVGFYVCLTGPSWNTAKVSLFNAASDPSLVAEMWDYQPIQSLWPTPSMCYALQCDRGEYLSQGHRSTALKLLPLTHITPPYRGDLKGLVEVLHRIEKDAQFLFVPGAMDYRRAEMELRKVNPADCVYTVRDYTFYLYELFSLYNLTADRSNRVDAHMRAEGVHPSPAGLWAWGHEAGVGFRREVLQSDLISELLTPGTARVRRDAVRFGGCDYMSDEIAQRQWTALARNSRGWDVPVYSYPGSVGQIWTPDTEATGLLKLRLSDQSIASPEVTWEELADTLAVATAQRPEEKHKNKLVWIDARHRMEGIRENAVRLTAEAVAQATGPAPSMTEARAIEMAEKSHPAKSEARVAEDLRREAIEAHEEMMRELLHSAN